MSVEREQGVTYLSTLLSAISMKSINAVPWQTWTESQSQVNAANKLSVVDEVAGENWDRGGARDEGREVEAGDGDD